MCWPSCVAAASTACDGEWNSVKDEAHGTGVLGKGRRVAFELRGES
jgi:hypothetical protein